MVNKSDNSCSFMYIISSCNFIHQYISKRFNLCNICDKICNIKRLSIKVKLSLVTSPVSSINEWWMVFSNRDSRSLPYIWRTMQRKNRHYFRQSRDKLLSNKGSFMRERAWANSFSIFCENLIDEMTLFFYTL